MVKLPPWSEDEPDITKLKKRNVFSVLVNAQNQLLVRGEIAQLSGLRERAKDGRFLEDARTQLQEVRELLKTHDVEPELNRLNKEIRKCNRRWRRSESEGRVKERRFSASLLTLRGSHSTWTRN